MKKPQPGLGRGCWYMFKPAGSEKGFQRARAFALLLAVLFVWMAGCGREAPVPQASSSGSASSGTSDATDLFKIRYRLKWLHQAQFAGAYMAREKGFYRQRGLDVEILPGGVDDPPYASLIEGSADITNFNLITALKYYESDQPVVSLAQMSQRNSTLLVGKKSSGIRTLQDLQGKKVGIWRDDSGEHVRFFLESQDLDIQVVPIDWSVNLLLNDAIDMMNAMLYNEYHRILMSGLEADELVVFDLADHGFDLADDGIFTLKSYYESHPKECQDFAKATMEGWEYALSHEQETLNVVLRYQRESYLPANPEHQAWMLSHMKTRVWEDPARIGQLDPADFELAQKILRDRGLLTKPVDIDSFHPHADAKEN